MLQPSDGIEVDEFYKNRLSWSEFLGFLPLGDDCLQYYSCENIGTDKSIERVTPVFGEYNHTVMTELEEWYSKESIDPNSKEKYKLQHEYYRDEFIECFENNKYCVWFVGCDDADYFMRFKDKDEAIQYLESISTFEEVYDNEKSMMW